MVYLDAPSPDGKPIAKVLMLPAFFPRFEAWAAQQGFSVEIVRDDEPNTYFVVPTEVPPPPGGTPRGY